MASLPVQGMGYLTRLTTAARLARVRPGAPVEVDAPGVLRTARLALRPLRWTDRPAFLEAARASEAQLAAFCPLHQEGEGDDAMFDRHLELTRAAEATGRAWRRVLEGRDGRIVGGINLNDIAMGLEARAEVSFWVRTEDAGQGLAGEALRAALGHAFRSRLRARLGAPGLGLSRVDALVAPANTPSLALLGRAGFEPDAAGPQALRIGGREVPHVRLRVFAPLVGDGAPSIESKPLRVRSSVATMLSVEAHAAERPA